MLWTLAFSRQETQIPKRINNMITVEDRADNVGQIKALVADWHIHQLQKLRANIDEMILTLLIRSRSQKSKRPFRDDDFGNRNIKLGEGD